MCGNKQQTLFDLKYFVPKSFVTAHNDLSLSVYLNAAIGEYRYKSPLSDQYQSYFKVADTHKGYQKQPLILKANLFLH